MAKYLAGEITDGEPSDRRREGSRNDAVHTARRARPARVAHRIRQLVRGWGLGQVDRDAAIAATREALALGVTLFDTAHAYGFGAAEELLGEALAPEIQRLASRS